MRPPDDDIINRLRKGERQAYTQLIDRYKDRGFSLALRILKNREDAEEALQDAFVRAYNGLRDFKGASSFGTWFYRILYNTCLTAVSRRRRQDMLSEVAEMDDADLSAVPEGGNSAMDAIENRDLMERVDGTLSRLPAKYSGIITMFYLQELSYAEISEVTGMPVGTVKTHLFRARALLQKEVQKDIPEKVAV